MYEAYGQKFPLVIGIDPGLKGAVARIGHVDVVCSGLGYEVWDAPTGKDGKQNVLLPTEMRKILVEAIAGLECMVFIEKVHAMRDQGRSSIFNFGDGWGMWKGICVGLGLPYELVTPQRWTKEMLAGMKGGKGSSIVRALELFPKAQVRGPRGGALDGRADALLIAAFGARKVAGQ